MFDKLQTAKKKWRWTDSNQQLSFCSNEEILDKWYKLEKDNLATANVHNLGVEEENVEKLFEMLNSKHIIDQIKHFFFSNMEKRECKSHLDIE